MKQLRGALVLAALLPTAAYAAADNFGVAMGAITWRAVAAWWLLSSICGLSALFFRVYKELQRTKLPLPNPGVFAAANVLGSWSAGLIAWFGGEGIGAPGMATAASIMVASFGGGAFIEALVAKQLRITFDGNNQPPLQPREP